MPEIWKEVWEPLPQIPQIRELKRVFALQQSQAVPQHWELCRGGREQLAAEQPHPEPSPLELPVQHAVDTRSTGAQSTLRPFHTVSLAGSGLTSLTLKLIFFALSFPQDMN